MYATAPAQKAQATGLVSAIAAMPEECHERVSMQAGLGEASQIGTVARPKGIPVVAFGWRDPGGAFEEHRG